MTEQVTIGLDVGGTKVAAARLAGQQIVERLTEPTDTSSGEALLAQMVRLAEQLRTPEVVGLGAGIASEVEWESGHVLGSVNIPLGDLPVRDMLQESTGLRTAIDNDGIATAVAEAIREDGSVVSELVAIAIGTGVGGGIIINGKPYRGVTGGAGHLGHTIVAGDAAAERHLTPFPRPDSLEAQASGHALDSLARAAAEAGRGSLGAKHDAGEPVSGRDVVDAAQDGDQLAVELLRRFSERIAPGVANAILVFDPQEVVICGGVSAAGDLLINPLREVVAPLVLPGVGTKTTIRAARFGPDAGVIGAAMLPLLADQAGAS